MTVRTLTSSAPPIVLEPGMILRLEAIDASTGAAVTGVTASRWSIYGEDMEPQDLSGEPLAPGPYMMVPGPQSSGG